jgi:hypothetical protein
VWRNVIIEGELLSGKTSFAAALREFDRNVTVIENRGLTRLQTGLDHVAFVVEHFRTLHSFLSSCVTPTIVTRGPLTAFAYRLIDMPTLTRIYQDVFSADHYIGVWLDLSFGDYLTYFETRKRSAPPFSRAEFEPRHELFRSGLQRIAGQVRAIPSPQADVYRVAKQITIDAKWETRQ